MRCWAEAPEVVEARIKQATANALHTPRGLFAKVRTLWEGGRLSDLSDEELELLGQDFLFSLESGGNQLAKMAVPGYSQASELLLLQEGAHFASYELAKRAWVLDPNIDARRRARLAQRDATHSSGSIQPQTSHGDPAIEYIINEMVDLQDRWSRGHLTDEEYKVKNTAQLDALRILVRQPRLNNTHTGTLHGLPSISFTGDSPASFTSGFPPINPSSSGDLFTPITVGGLVMLDGPSRGAPLMSGSPSRPTTLEGQSGMLQSGSFDRYPANTHEAFGQLQANMVPGNNTSVPRPPPQSARFERGAGGWLRWPPVGATPIPRAILGKELEQEGKAEGLSDSNFFEYVCCRWDELTDEELAAYEAKHEAARLKAWEEYDKVKLDDPMEEARRLSKLKRKALLDEQIRLSNSQGKKP